MTLATAATAAILLVIVGRNRPASIIASAIAIVCVATVIATLDQGPAAIISTIDALTRLIHGNEPS